MNFYILNNIGLDNKYNHTIDFPIDETGKTESQIKVEKLLAQKTFWDAKILLTFQDIKFVANDQIKLTIDYNTIRNYSYCCYEVTINLQTKRFYAFINKIQKIGVSQVLLTLQTDVLQSYYTDYKLNDSFITRQHEDRIYSSGGVIYRNFSTEPENLYIGENYKETLYDKLLTPSVGDITTDDLYFIIVQSTNTINAQNNKLPSALMTFIFPVLYKHNVGENHTITIYHKNTNNAYPSLELILQKLAVSDSVISINVLPLAGFGALSYSEAKYRYTPADNILEGSLTIDGTSYACLYPSIKLVDYYKEIDKQDKITTLPTISDNKNELYESKLYSYPYFFYELYRANNNPHIIKNEFLPDGDTFEIHYNFTADGIIREKTFVKQYKIGLSSGYSPNNEFDVINMEDLPMKSNLWYNYYLNNKNVIQSSSLLKLANTFAGLGANLVSGNYIGGLVGSLGGLSSVLMQQLAYKDIQEAPDKIKTIGNSGTYMMQSKYGHYYLFIKDLLPEFKSKLYDFFFRYGYKVNKFGIPNLESRYYFNFIQLSNTDINSSLNCEIVDELKNIYTNGLTIWHYRNSSTFRFKNYEKENVEMSII